MEVTKGNAAKLSGYILQCNTKLILTVFAYLYIEKYNVFLYMYSSMKNEASA
jgi:hypothetical protein